MEHINLLSVENVHFFDHNESSDLVYNVAEQLEKITWFSEYWGLTPKNREYFLSKMQEDKCITYLDTNNQVVWMGTVEQFTSEIAYYPHIFVDKNHRNNDFWANIISNLEKKVSWDIKLMTLRPNHADAYEIFLNAVSAGFLPVHFSVLQKKYPDLIRQICRSCSCIGWECALVDNYCILLIKDPHNNFMKESLEYLGGLDFLFALYNGELREQVLEWISNYQTKKFSYNFGSIKQYIQLKMLQMWIL